jgi:hypothetical protein
MDKLKSGRYLLTVICGLVFAFGAVTKIIPPDAVISIVSMVFISYFQRQDRGTQQKGQV